MKRLLVVDASHEWWDPLLSELRLRSVELEVERVETVDEARRRVQVSVFDAVLITTRLKRLSLGNFLGLLPKGTRVFLIGDEFAGATTLVAAEPKAVVSALCLALDIARSTTFDVPVVARLGTTGAVRYELVRWPGVPEPLARAQLERHAYSAAMLIEAARAATVHGPGLAQTLEVFWDDPRPHVVQVVPPGLSLTQLLAFRGAWGVDVALTVGRAVSEGVATLQRAGFSAGQLSPASIWLTDEGDALLLGSGLSQLPLARGGVPGLAPPEEHVDGVTAPRGDAWRLVALMVFVSSQTHALRTTEGAAGLTRHAVLGPHARLFQRLAGPASERPMGDELRALLDEAAGAQGREVLREAVAEAKAGLPPTRPWELP